MKESELYLRFFKSNYLILTTSILLCIFISIFFISRAPAKIKVSQSFKIIYNTMDLGQKMALTDQAVGELRAQKFSASYPKSSILVYKSAPLLIEVDSLAEKEESAYNLGLKASKYLTENFEVSRLSQSKMEATEPNIFKYILTGVLAGFLIGLFFSLVREYFTNY